jgi:hypothetical protein
MAQGMAPNPRAYDELHRRVEALQHENELLRAQLEAGAMGSMFSLKKKTFHAATGFRRPAECLSEAESCGALARLSTLGRHEVECSTAHLEEQAQVLHALMPTLGEEVDLALARCLQRSQKRQKKGDGRGAKAKIDERHLFLIPFLYVVGGFQQWAAPMLDGLRCSQQHFSRLLALSFPVVVDSWAKRYYRKRNMAWLRENCPPSHNDPEGADCTLFYDGSKYEVERSAGMREQRMTFSSVVNYNILQFIGVTNARGWFVESSLWAGGKMKEVDMVWTLDLWNRIEAEAAAQDRPFWIHLIVDRGFRDNSTWIDSEQQKDTWPWPHLILTCEVVKHLGTEAEPDRTQHPVEEVVENRYVQARRWVNEKAFAVFDASRFFDRVIQCTSIESVHLIKELNMGISNMRMGVPPVD